MIYILSIISLVVLIIFLIDGIPQFNTWQSRIKIGRFQKYEDWQNKVLQISKKWLKNIPAIPLTDNKRLIVIDMLNGNYKRTTIQSWQEAALVLGLTEYLKNNGDSKMQKEIEVFFNFKTSKSGAWKMKPAESDQAILAYAFINADFIDLQKHKPAFDETYQMILSLKGAEGTIAYKTHNRDFRFVDTIGFICPFLTSYGLRFDVPEAVSLAVKQITEYQKYGMMKNENIPCHTYNITSKIPTGLFGWGRGIGWFVIGLIDTWKALPENHPDKETLKRIVIDTAKSVVKFQNENGSFHWLIFDEQSRLDSSIVATLSWFFIVAAEISEISEICLAAKAKGLKYLQSVTRRNGAVDFSQGDTKAIGIYSQNFDILPFTQGFVLRTLNYLPDAL